MPRQQPKSVQLSCECGWNDALPAMAGGVVIECPQCGRNLRVPGSMAPESQADIAIVERLTGRKFTPTENKDAAALIPLTYFAMLTVLPLAAVSLIVHWGNYWPAGAIWPIGGVLWAAGIFIARFGMIASNKGEPQSPSR